MTGEDDVILPFHFYKAYSETNNTCWLIGKAQFTEFRSGH